MTRYEVEMCTAITHNVPSISKSLKAISEELKRANALKAIELKAAYPDCIPLVDAAFESRL